MNLHFSNGTARQQRWVNDAIAGCSYPYDSLHVNVTIVFTTLTNCPHIHTYMCTTPLGNHNYQIQVEPWADDPANPNNAGLPDPYHDLHEFFIDTFIHETGHVVQDELLNTPAKIEAACECFVHKTDGRRGHAADYFGNETSKSWPEMITEAISEWFRLTFRQHAQVYWNRTNWHLAPGHNPLEGLPAGPKLKRGTTVIDPVTGKPVKKPVPIDKTGDYARLMQVLIPSGWKYGEPITLSGSVEYREGDGDKVLISDGGGVAWLGRRAFVNGIDFAGAPIINAPDFSAGGGLPNDFVGLRFGPTLFGRPSTWTGFTSPGGHADQTGEDTAVFDVGALGTIREYEPSQPGFNPHLGRPGIDQGDKKSWSGWRVTRAAILKLEYWEIQRAVREAGFQGWAVVEVSETGHMVIDNTPGSVSAYRRGVGFHGPVASSIAGGDSGNPWADSGTIAPSDIGGQPDNTVRGPLQNGWYAAASETDITSCTIGHDFDWEGGSGGSGTMWTWMGTSDLVIVAPGPNVVAAPSTPLGMGPQPGRTYPREPKWGLREIRNGWRCRSSTRATTTCSRAALIGSETRSRTSGQASRSSSMTTASSRSRLWFGRWSAMTPGYRPTHSRTRAT